MLDFLQQRWFLLALLGVLTLGMLLPGPLAPIAAVIPRGAIVATVMFLMALPLETSALWMAVRRPGPAWLAAAFNAGVAPPLGWLASRVLPEELAIGVIVATVVPCTLAAASVWTRRAGGNDAVAILVTLITNLGCFLVIPAWLRWLVGREAAVNYGDLTAQLALLVVVPVAAAQLARQWPRLGAWAVRRKRPLGELAQAGILGMVFVGAVGCGERIRAASNGEVLTAANVAIMIAVVAAVHIALLAGGMATARALGMRREDAIAVGIAGSQKTIMVGVYLALAFSPLAILPMVAYHTLQLVIDTIVADRLRGSTGSAESPGRDRPLEDAP